MSWKNEGSLCDINHITQQVPAGLYKYGCYHHIPNIQYKMHEKSPLPHTYIKKESITTNLTHST